MSELKVHKAYNRWIDEEMPTPNDDLICNEVYLKSEADKVIDELKQKINEAQTELELWRDGSIISEPHQKELDEKRHSDYKRCLAMARIAQDDWHLHNSFYAVGHREFEKRKCEFYEKWHKRWLELAEKFNDKEAK